MLEVRGLVSGYGMITVLRGVDMTVPAGTITCLLGRNGAGKTTTLFTIAGVVRARAGTVTFNGAPLVGKSPDEIVRLGVALVPENRLVFPRMTVEENLLAGAYPRLRRQARQVRNDVEAMYARFPILKERRRQLAGTLSGGQQQLLALARSLMSRPQLLMLDEPSLGLAPLIVREIFNVLRDLHREGCTILLVEQNVRQALALADHVYLIDQGQIRFSGTRDQFAADNRLKETYLGKYQAV